MKFRKTFWINILIIFLFLSIASTRLNPAFTDHPNVYHVLFLYFVCLSPLLSNIALKKQNAGKLNLIAIILSGINILFGFYFALAGYNYQTFFVYCLPPLLSIIALMSLRANEDLFLTFRMFVTTLIR